MKSISYASRHVPGPTPPSPSVARRRRADTPAASGISAGPSARSPGRCCPAPRRSAWSRSASWPRGRGERADREPVRQPLGFDNYAAFQQALRDDLEARVKSPLEVYRSHVEHGATPRWRRQEAHSQSRHRDDAPAQLDRFRGATEYLADSRHRVVMAGGWSSHLLAGYLTCCSGRSARGTPGPTRRRRASGCAGRPVARDIVVSSTSDATNETRSSSPGWQALRRQIVLLTDPWLSPVADLADAVLPAQVVGPSPFESLTPTLAVVETLVTAVAQGLGEVGDRRFSHYGGIADHWVRPWPSYDDLDATEDSDQPSERGTSASPDRPDPRSR